MIHYLYLLTIPVVLVASVVTVWWVRENDIVTIDELDQEDDEESTY